jgi:hypothetical protein
MYYLDEQGKRVYTLKVRRRLGGGRRLAGGVALGAGVGAKGGEGGGAREVLWRWLLWRLLARRGLAGAVLCCGVRGSHVRVRVRFLTLMLARSLACFFRSLALCRRRQRTGRRPSRRTRHASRRTTSTPSTA